MAVHTKDVVLSLSSSFQFKLCENLILEDNFNNTLFDKIEQSRCPVSADKFSKISQLHQKRCKFSTERRTLRLSESRSKVSFDYAECEQSQDRKAGLKEKGEIHPLRFARPTCLRGTVCWRGERMSGNEKAETPDITSSPECKSLYVRD